MTNYKNGKIYRIVCNETGEQYIGSTTVPLSRRLANHVYDIKNNTRKCKSSSIIERGNYEIVLIEECPCETKEQLHARERHYIETMVCVNKVVPLQTATEWHIKNKTYKNNYSKMYRVENKKRIHNREHQYYEQNKELILQKDREFRKANKERLNARRRELYALKKQQTPEI